MNPVLFILYVRDQADSRAFYSNVFGAPPSLDVPGMTEFDLPNGAKLGLMPERNIATIVSPPLPAPSSGHGIPRCEVYLTVDDPAMFIQRALAAGAGMISELQPRDWGDDAGYLSDPDGHVIVFAKKTMNDE